MQLIPSALTMGGTKVTMAVLKRRTKNVGACLIVLLVAAFFAFILFRSRSVPGGYIDLKYSGTSTTGIFWNLENRSTQTIYLRGTGNGNSVWPSSLLTKCKTLDYSSEESDPTYLADGFFSVIKISPGESIRFHVETSLPSRYKRGHCYLRLSLLGGTFVESPNFTPN